MAILIAFIVYGFALTVALGGAGLRATAAPPGRPGRVRISRADAAFMLDQLADGARLRTAVGIRR
jgi:hypothetical protein